MQTNMKIASLEPANFELFKLYHRDAQSLNRLVQLNFDTLSNYFTKKSEIVGCFLLLWKSDFDDLITSNNKKQLYINKPSVTKIETADRVNLLHSTSCRFEHYES